MRRSDEEFKTELMLRVKDYRRKQLRRRKTWSVAATLAASMLIMVVLNIPKIGAITESMRENSGTLDVAQEKYPAGDLYKGPGTGKQTTTEYLYSDVEDVAGELPEYVVEEIDTAGIATAETDAAVKDVAETGVSETDGNATAGMLAGSQIQVNASETVQIISLSMKTEQGEHESEDQETITQVMTFLTNIQRMNADQSFMTSESASVTEEENLSEPETEEELTGSLSDWRGNDDAEPTKAVQEYAVICRLTMYYADGSTYDYELHQGEAFRSVMGDDGAEMSLTVEQWKQLEALLETVLAE